MTEPVQPTADQLRAVNEAQTPAEYIAAAQAAGVTGDAAGLALGGAHPVSAPDFAAMLEQFKADQQAQIDKMQADFEAQLAALRAGVPAPLVDPRVSVARNFADGVALLARSYPHAARVEAAAKSAAVLAGAIAAQEGVSDAVPVPDAAVVADVIKRFRRFAQANPQLETGLVEHAAQLAEDVFDL
jgi:hypothetical protein